MFDEPIARAAQPGVEEAGKRHAHGCEVLSVKIAQLCVVGVSFHQVVEVIGNLANDPCSTDKIERRLRLLGYGHLVFLCLMGLCGYQCIQACHGSDGRSEEHTSELQSLMRI